MFAAVYLEAETVRLLSRVHSLMSEIVPDAIWGACQCVSLHNFACRRISLHVPAHRCISLHALASDWLLCLSETQ